MTLAPVAADANTNAVAGRPNEICSLPLTAGSMPQSRLSYALEHRGRASYAPKWRQLTLAEALHNTRKLHETLPIASYMLPNDIEGMVGKQEKRP